MVYIDEHIGDFDLQTALQQISQQRREQALRFKHEQGQRTCVLAYLLLKKALREEYGIHENPVFEYGEHGKPCIAGRPDIHFNLSHCRHAVACALSSRPIGIDVESVREYSESLVRYTMSDAETSAILSSPAPDVAFTRLWTMKEALLKLTGQGISNHIKHVLATDGYTFDTVECLQQGYVYTVARQIEHN
jgi:4'-phosphopantetheinyl transferase